MSSSWLYENVKRNHGRLGALYPQSYVSEGDTPSFLHLVNNGLESYKDYTLGGWGGRSEYDDPVNKPNHVTDKGNVNDDGNRNKMYWRWIIPAQNDFAARMDWCVASNYKEANHQPIAQVVGGNVRTVEPGETVTLDASPTIDPDGDSLTFYWWQYYDADNAVTKVTIKNPYSKNNASFIVPNEPGKQIHIILEVTDNGNPPLTSYQRIIFNISKESAVRQNCKITSEFKLYPIYPNPFNAEAQIRFFVPQTDVVSIKVFDITGKEKEKLLHKKLESGEHTVVWDASNLCTGLYFIRVSYNRVYRISRCILIK